MTLSVFDDKATEPTFSELKAALGDTARFLEEIEEHIEGEYGGLEREWKYYTKKAGWTMSLVHKRRKVLGLIPHHGTFEVGFVLGKRAVASIPPDLLPAEILSLIEEAREYVEGGAFRFGVGCSADVDTVRKLIAIKMAK